MRKCGVYPPDVEAAVHVSCQYLPQRLPKIPHHTEGVDIRRSRAHALTPIALASNVVHDMHSLA